MTDFDEAIFQAHLTQGRRLLESRISTAQHQATQDLASKLLQQLHNDFVSGFKLSTGLSMELLWNLLRPTPIPDKPVFDRSLELDRLGVRFDNLRWKAGASIPDLSKAQKTLEQAYRIIRDGATTTEELIADLTIGIKALEARIRSEESDLKPFFANEFEVLRQLSLLHSIHSEKLSQNLSQDLSILSNVPTKAGLMTASSSQEASTLQSVDCLACQDQYSWDGKFTTSLWSKLREMGLVRLDSLSLLEAELPALGQHIASLSMNIATDPLTQLNNILWQLLLEAFGSHGQNLRDEIIKAYSLAENHFAAISHLVLTGLTPDVQLFETLIEEIELVHLRQIAMDHFVPVIIALATAKNDQGRKAYFSALAWIHFSVGVLKLYVPDRVFDPQLRPKLEREFLQELQNSLDEKISALMAFETKFTGQKANERIELLRHEVVDLGPLPEEVQPIYRPERSELNKLHAEFSNVLKSVTGTSLQSVMQCFTDTKGVSQQGLQLVKENVGRLVDRLSNRFEAYQDMTRPTVNLLRCLLIGFSLHDVATSVELKNHTEELTQMIPFLGGRQWDIRDCKLPERSFELLGLVNVAIAVEGVESLQISSRELIFDCFHSFYNDWKNKLEIDRKAEEEKGGLFRFRGSLEDEEEIDAQEFNELFPTYDDNEEQVSKPAPEREQVRNTSLRVAEAHKKLFFDQANAESAIKELCLAVGDRIAKETKDQVGVDRAINTKMLSSTLLLLDEKSVELQSSESASSYNFYTDSNLSEARQLVALMNKLKMRFRQLQLVDEIGHMQPLEDVVQACDKVLEIVHSSPLAMILPKVEQLHVHVYEWQFGGWASHVHGVLTLHTALTDTIIRWRRLELSTWAKIFDMEEKKCQEDAYSWWFVAYQVVIAVPLSMVDSTSELQTYSVALIQNLELYFSSSIVGQFKTRVTLLQQLQSHLQLLTKDYPTLNIIYNSLTHFIRYFIRYENAASSAIQHGRTSLEKKMKDVLLMASWKDTNINALRESARKSHQKLFRIVRKFRGILGQEMKSFIEQGLPDEEINKSTRKEAEIATVAAASDAMLTSLNTELPDWLGKHKRLANFEKTVSIMQKVADSPEMASSVPQTLDDFVASLESSMTDLRTETPQYLTDENKEQIKHLKTRKRKLFADTLRDLRNMGLRHNLGQDKLAAQASLAVVLASVKPLETLDGISFDEAEYYLHKVLNLAPKARAAAPEHSEDLTGAEVGRSIGFVEGMIEFAMAQRESLASIIGPFLSLRTSVRQFQDLGNFQRTGSLTWRQRDSNWSRMLPWVAQGLKFVTQLVQVHGKLGKIEHDSLIKKLESWSNRIQSQLVKLDNLSELPKPFTSEAHTGLERDFSEDLMELQTDVEEAIGNYPGLEFILQQLRIWTLVQGDELETQVPSLELSSFAESVSTLCDTVLVAVENARKAGKEIPRKEDDLAWLKKHNDAYFTMISQLHIKNVERRINRCVQSLQKIDLAQIHLATAAMSAIALASNILDKFVTVCEQSIRSGVEIHRATVQMSYKLTKAFTQIASQGFCTPQEKSDETSGDSGKLEAGTGLGDGDGAEDISKDIQPDEDLSELAQEANKEQTDEIEDEKDAVDMADEDLEGEMGSVAGADDDDEDGSQKGDEEEEDNDMDEEAGDVDDLDPTAVDEKMWDGDDEKAEKDQQGDKAKGQKQDDEQMAADGDAEQDETKQDTENKDADEPEAEDIMPEEEDVKAQEEMNRQDQNVEEKDALDLPEDMDLNLDDPENAGSEDDDLDIMSDAEDDQEQEQPAAEDGGDDEEIDDAAARQLEQEAEAEEEITSEPEVEDKIGPDEAQEEVEPDKEEPETQEQDQTEEQKEEPPKEDEAMADTENAAPSDVKSSGQDQNADSMDLDDQFQANAAQQEDGEMGDAAADQDTSAGNKGATSRSNKDVAKPEPNDEADQPQNDPFKKLGDALERWHRQQMDIHDADPEEKKAEQQEGQKNPEAEQARKEFQHLQNDDDAADTQALGKADDEVAQPMDESMAIDEEKEDPSSHLMNEDSDKPVDDEPDVMDLSEPDEDEKDTGAADQDDPRTGVKTRQGNYNREPTPEDQETQDIDGDELDEESVMDASAQLSMTHISDEQMSLRDFSECMQQWTEFQSKSHSLSLSLTSQLRLILTPSQSTKLSGSFRTGKRLNIKRIIPYIASSYKRDKIWMRRSIPTKRTYQILLCVDDSQSMGESSSGTLAMESLVMVSRSLTMLEAGQVGVLGFGKDVFTAHNLTEPFASDAGAKVLQKFSFKQDRTDIALLIRQTIDTFRTARQQQSSGSGADLWQLALILSDGLTPSSAHDSIRRLLREALEERIMVVFIIMDDTGKKKGDSVLELKEARFVNDGGESKVVIERYLDTFPFQYYLIVHNLDELPTALAGLLRTWFAEVTA